MILRIVGQNGGGSRVYVRQINRALNNQSEHVVTFYKNYKKGDPLTDPVFTKDETYFSINILYLCAFVIKNRNKIKYIHTHLRNATIIGYILSKLFGLKHIITIHIPLYYGKPSFKDRVMTYIFKRAIYSSSLNIFISEFILEYIKNKFDENKIKNYEVIYNGTDEVKKPISYKRNSPFKIVIVGELTDRKRVDQVLELAKYLENKLKKIVVFDIYGSGPLYNKIKENIEVMNFNFIRLKGNEYDLDKIYGDAKLHLIFAEDEAFGRVVTEAMSYGVPTVAYNSGAFPELIKNGAGKLFSNNEQCAKILFNYVFNVELLERDRDLAIKAFYAKFTNEIFEKNTIRAIENSTVS